MAKPKPDGPPEGQPWCEWPPPGAEQAFEAAVDEQETEEVLSEGQ